MEANSGCDKTLIMAKNLCNEVMKHLTLHRIASVAQLCLLVLLRSERADLRATQKGDGAKKVKHQMKKNKKTKL
jgi:hypothetical protein